jgi:peptidoglycan/LPS O-acetylase OafA/YrhL
MNNPPRSVPITLGFILIITLIWLALGTIIAFHAHPTLPDNPLILGGMAVLSFIAAGVLLVLLIFLRKRRPIAWFLAVAALAVSSLMAIFDEIGLSDLVVLVINVIPIILLIKDRDWYLKGKSGA